MMNGIYNLIPQIRRARDYHLYDFNGRRFLDCSLDEGRAILGHKPGKAVLMMKNALDKGLSAPYPGVYSHRLLKQLKLLHSGIAGCSVVFTGGKAKAFPVVRPFENDGSVIAFPDDSPFRLILPLPGSGMIDVVCAAVGSADVLPPDDRVPQYLLSGLCRAAAELTAFSRIYNPGRWSAFDSPLWNRKGAWLYPLAADERYSEFFKLFLDRGILISPDPEIPSCVPYQFTEGEIVPIKEIEKNF